MEHMLSRTSINQSINEVINKKAAQYDSVEQNEKRKAKMLNGQQGKHSQGRHGLHQQKYKKTHKYQSKTTVKTAKVRKVTRA